MLQWDHSSTGITCDYTHSLTCLQANKGPLLPHVPVGTNNHKSSPMGQCKPCPPPTLYQGDTTEALLCLANYPFLLAHASYAQDGDTVWHLLAEFGDISLLQALVNFCKIHPPPTKRKSSRRRAAEGQEQTHCDNAILSLVNVGNALKQTPLMFAAYHGRDDVIAFLLHQASPRFLAVTTSHAAHEVIYSSPPFCVSREQTHGPPTGADDVRHYTTPA